MNQYETVHILEDGEPFESGTFYCDCGELIETNGEEDIQCYKCGQLYDFNN